MDKESKELLEEILKELREINYQLNLVTTNQAAVTTQERR